MNRLRAIGIAMFVIGLALVIMGAQPPRRTLMIIAGALFMLSGMLRLVRSSRMPPGPPPPPMPPA